MSFCTTSRCKSCVLAMFVVWGKFVFLNSVWVFANSLKMYQKISITIRPGRHTFSFNKLYKLQPAFSWHFYCYLLKWTNTLLVERIGRNPTLYFVLSGVSFYVGVWRSKVFIYPWGMIYIVRKLSWYVWSCYKFHP